MNETETKSKHTPGPWVRWPDEDQRTGYPGNIELGQRNGFRIATVWRTPRQDEEANARLIAASPALLEALKELMSSRHPIAAAWEKARAAIGLAEGKAL